MRDRRSPRVVVLGDRQVGKSALTVRFLTRRFIGEYQSSIDLVYKYGINFDTSATTEVEILDSCGCKQTDSGLPTESQVMWGDVFLLVYSITDRASFAKIPRLVRSVQRARAPHRAPIVIVGNKRDLDHLRAVNVDDAQQVALEYGCQFYEVSAAESGAGVSLAFHTALREASAGAQRKLDRHVRTSRPGNGSLVAVSKILGHLFAKRTSEKISSKSRSASLGSAKSSSATAAIVTQCGRAKSLSL